MTVIEELPQARPLAVARVVSGLDQTMTTSQSLQMTREIIG